MTGLHIIKMSNILTKSTQVYMWRSHYGKHCNIEMQKVATNQLGVPVAVSLV